jgi:hypothetical protein
MEKLNDKESNKNNLGETVICGVLYTSNNKSKNADEMSSDEGCCMGVTRSSLLTECVLGDPHTYSDNASVSWSTPEKSAIKGGLKSGETVMQQKTLPHPNYENHVEANTAIKEALQPWEDDEKPMRQQLKQKTGGDENILLPCEDQEEQYDYDEEAMKDLRLTEKNLLVDMLSKYPEQEGRRYHFIKKIRENFRAHPPVVLYNDEDENN